MARALVVIPARWASSRFPGKVLASLGGRPLLCWACAIAARARRVGEFVVATDDERILAAVRAAGFPAELTRPDHASGADRVAEVAARRDAEIIVGLQADEPFLAPDDLDNLIAALEADPALRLATLAGPLDGPLAWRDPDTVKVVVDRTGRALYFSRAPIPHRRSAAGLASTTPEDQPPPEAQQHVGLYAWRRAALAAFAALPVSPLERTEGLEQLRALEAGWAIRVLPAVGRPFGVDTPTDLERAAAELAARGSSG